MTTVERELVETLRRKVGDNPTRVVVSNDIGTTIYFPDGTSTVATLADVGKIILDVGKTIWSDDELLSEIVDSFYIIFGYSKKNLEELDELEKRIVVLAARIELTYQLATNATRYIRYQAQNVNISPVDPSEFLNLAKSLKESLKEILDDYVGRESEKIKVGILNYIDRYEDLMKPTNYQPTPVFPDFKVEYVNTVSPPYIRLYAPYTFINNFREIFIKKSDGTTETIIFETDICKEYDVKDYDVTTGKTYTYTVFLRTLNDDLYNERYSISI